jgi:hypothetical protein
MSVETLERNYGHHHPDHLRRAAHAIGYAKTPGLVSVVESWLSQYRLTGMRKKIILK